MKHFSVLLLSVLLLIGSAGCASGNAGKTAAPSVQPSANSQAAATPKGEPTPKDYLEIGFDLMDKEALGQLKLNMTESQLTEKIGKPNTKSKAQVWGADGFEHSTWSFTKIGLSIDMQKEVDSKAESVVYSITAKAPCDYATLRGIKIGDKKEAVLSAYRDEVDQQAGDDQSIVIGSVYGGIIVGIKNGMVQSIFIGASAE